MRKTSTLALLFIGLMMFGLLPTPQTFGSHFSPTFVARCDPDGGQGPGCENIVIREVPNVATLDTWDPAWSYNTLTASWMGSVYEQPVEYKGLSTANLVPSAAILSQVNDGETFTFTIAQDTHFYRIPPNGTLMDLGEVMASDWAYAILRSIAQCSPSGAAPVVYPFVYGAADFFNGGCTAGGWTTFQALSPITSDNTAGTFTVKVDGDLNSTNGQDPFPAMLGVLANTWAAVYSQSYVEGPLGCGSLTSQVGSGECASLEAITDVPYSLGSSGPYLFAENETTTGSWALVKNPNYCQGDRTTYTICGGSTPGPERAGFTHTQRPPRILYKEVPLETTRVSDLLNGRTDTAGIGLPANLLAFLEGANLDTLHPNLVDEFNVYPAETLTVSHIGMMYSRDNTVPMEPGSSDDGIAPYTSKLEGSCTPAPTSGCLARRAILAGWNYTNYIRVTLLGLGKQLADFIPSNLLGNEEDATAAGYLSAPVQNRTRAVELFRAAGYARNAPLRISCGYNAESEVRKKICFQMADDLQALRTNNLDGSGSPAAFVFVAPLPYRAPVWFNHVFGTQSFDVYPWGWFPDYVDPDDFARPYYRSDGTWAGPTIGFASATIDAKVDAAAADTNPVTRETKYFELMRDASAECSCYVPLDQQKIRPVIIESLSGYGDRGTNPAFLYPNRDWIKTLLTPPPTPVFPSGITILLAITMLLATMTVLLKRHKTYS